MAGAGTDARWGMTAEARLDRFLRSVPRCPSMYLTVSERTLYVSSRRMFDQKSNLVIRR